MRGGEERKEEERVIVIACLTFELIMNHSIRHALGTRPRALSPVPLAEERIALNSDIVFCLKEYVRLILYERGYGIREIAEDMIYCQ